MNKKQKIVLWVGIGIFVLMGLFPPWVLPNTIKGTEGSMTNRRSLGYKPIWMPPKGKKQDDIRILLFGASIDFHSLIVQWSMVAVVTSGLFFTLKK